MTLSVVITTFNREKILRGLLDNLKNQTDKDFEVVVAMDNCTDNTELMLKNYKGLDLKWIDTEIDGYGLARARNLGIQKATGEAIVILDDDSYPDQYFIQEHKRTAMRGVLTSGARFPDTEEDVDNLNGKMQFLLEHYGANQPRKMDTFVVENNCCMLKVNWLQHPFNEEIQHYGGVGQDFIKRLRENNYDFQFNPDAKIVHLSTYKRNYYDIHGNNGGEK